MKSNLSLLPTQQHTHLLIGRMVRVVRGVRRHMRRDPSLMLLWLRRLLLLLLLLLHKPCHLSLPRKDHRAARAVTGSGGRVWGVRRALWVGGWFRSAVPLAQERWRLGHRWVVRRGLRVPSHLQKHSPPQHFNPFNTDEQNLPV
jgi:hypothetical protein